MFLIHGIRRKVLGEHALPGTCVQCGATGGLLLHVLQPYVHFFWLPLFPLPKRGRSTCAQCGHLTKHGKLPPAEAGLFHLLKREHRTPWWTFTGLALLAVIVPWGIGEMNEHNTRQQALIHQPQVGDIWTIKLGHKHYTLQRVVEVRPDSVFLRGCGSSVHGGVLDLTQFQGERKRAYEGDVVGHARSELDAYDRGPLYSISRE